MRHLLFASLALALGLTMLSAAAPPSVKRAAEEADDDEGIQDVLYVGQPHPVLLRLRLRVEGKSAFAHYDECMNQYFAFLDRNDNKTLDKNEAAKAPPAATMLALFAGNPIINGRGTGRAGEVPLTEFDLDRDGKVTLEEFKAYYAKNGAGPLTMTAPMAVRFSGLPGAPPETPADVVFGLLDADRDGKLSKKELENAERSLLKYDADDNEMVSMAELGLAQNNARGRLVEAVSTRARQPMATPQAANMLLVSREDTGKRKAGKTALARELIAKYDKDKDGALGRDEIGFSKKLFDTLDRNKDGKLSLLELTRWLDGKPAGDFTIRLRDLGGAMARKDVMRTGATLADMDLSLDGVRIKVVPQTGVATRRNIDQFITQQFKAADEDKKGFLTRKQVEGNSPQATYLRALFDLGDRNNDGKFTEAELKAALGAMNAMQGAQLSLSIFSTGNGLFQALDADGDGRLSLRELRGAAARLATLDANKDGYVSRDEFPQQFQLNVGQTSANIGFVGGPGMGGQPPARPRTRGPVWFAKMDRNGDGDVSPAEWLGTKDDFDEIDADKDGLISTAEAEAYDARKRKLAQDD